MFTSGAASCKIYVYHTTIVYANYDTENMKVDNLIATYNPCIIILIVFAIKRKWLKYQVMYLCAKVYHVTTW